MSNNVIDAQICSIPTNLLLEPDKLVNTDEWSTVVNIGGKKRVRDEYDWEYDWDESEWSEPEEEWNPTELIVGVENIPDDDE